MMWKLTLALLFAFPAYADTAQNLQVSITAPWFPDSSPPPPNISISFDWNTGTNTISNMAVASPLAGSLAWTGYVGFTSTGALWTMNFGTAPNGGDFFQIDSDLYAPSDSYWIRPQPGTYTVGVFEYCVAPDCTSINSTYTGLDTQFRWTATVTDPVATPEPSTLLLLGVGGAITLLAAFAFRYLITAAG